MDKKQYMHPTRHSARHDYKHDMRRIDKHISDAVHDDYGLRSLQHLGGAASLHDHLTDLYFGEACEVKRELVTTLDLLYEYWNTCHNIYYFFAEESFKHAEMAAGCIMDEEEREYAECFLEYVKEYMCWIKDDKAGHHAEGADKPTSGGAYNL